MQLINDELPDFVIEYDTDCCQAHNYFDLDTGLEYKLAPEPKTKPVKPKAKPKAKPPKPKPKTNLEIAQKILDDYYYTLFHFDDELSTSFVTLSNEIIFFYNTPTAETEMKAAIANKIAELNTTYNVGLTRPSFETDDNQQSSSSFQSWQPDWETVKWDDFWTKKFPPLKRCRAKKSKAKLSNLTTDDVVE